MTIGVPALWGMGFAAAIYLLGNGLWANRWVRRRRWLGWLLWLVSCALVLVAGAAIENHLGTGRSILDRLTSVDAENHWIALTLYALMSVPGAASVILGQGRFWTRLALIAVALLIFVPTAFHLGSDIGTPAPAFAIAAALCGLLWLWQAVLDDDPSG